MFELFVALELRPEVRPEVRPDVAPETEVAVDEGLEPDGLRPTPDGVVPFEVGCVPAGRRPTLEPEPGEAGRPLGREAPEPAQWPGLTGEG